MLNPASPVPVPAPVPIPTPPGPTKPPNPGAPAPRPPTGPSPYGVTLLGIVAFPAATGNPPAAAATGTTVSFPAPGPTAGGTTAPPCGPPLTTGTLAFSPPAAVIGTPPVTLGVVVTLLG